MIALLAGLCCASARAQLDATHEGLASNGLCGLGVTGFPVCPKRVGVAATGSYGYLESMGPIEGGHHRIGGTLGAGITPLPFLSVALRLDGRLDFHPDDALGSDYTGMGDPRLFLRGGHALSRELAVGGEAVLWFPGNKAPSFEPRATSVDLKAMAAWTPQKLPLALLGHLGYRFDQSSNSAPNVRELRPGDRIALSLSESDAVLLAVGASTRALAPSELFAELSLDYLVGSKAPKGAQSPMRATLGARGFLNPTWQGEVSATLALNGRARVGVDSAWVPIEPRFLLNVGVRYGFDLSPPVAPPPPVDDGVAATDEPVGMQRADLHGRVVDDANAPLPDVRITLTTPPPSSETQETITDGEGRYMFPQVPTGPVTLQASAPGFDTLHWTLEVRPGMPEDALRPLVRKSDLGTLRLLTRTFTSDPLRAAVTLRDARGRKVQSGKTNEQGVLEFDVPAGRYIVMISAPGYRPHQREVQIERYGVAIMNVDMREQK